MTRSGTLASLFAGAVLLVLAPLQSFAQSTIQGTVKDSSGSVIAGATVEAASPALIEKVRTVTTDGQGRYNVYDIRPGTYTVTASAPGFASQKREAIDVPSNVTVSVNIDMAVGAATETVTVKADVPVVDVENSARTEVLTREVQDSIPNARNMQSLAGLTPGIRLTTPDVGGSQQMEQTYITGHGSGAAHTTVLLDGMNINSNYSDGAIQTYLDNALIAQTTIQTMGVGAEVASGGTLVNHIPRDGGNEVHGDVWLSGTAESWQSTNVNKALTDRGLTGAGKIYKIEDYDGDIGGPVLKNKLWYLFTYRYQSTFDSPPNTFYPNGAPGIEDQTLKSYTGRFNWQISSKDKFSGTFEKPVKFKGHELTGITYQVADPATASQRRGSPMYYTAQGKWTRTWGARLISEMGYSTDQIHYSVVYQPGIEQVPFSPAWYTTISKVDLGTGIRSNAAGVQSFYLSDHRIASAAVTYVSGSHILKVGVQDGWGKNDRVSSINGDLVANFLNGAPQNVTVYNTPIAARQRMGTDLGAYITDNWKVSRRLTLNLGLRFEYEKSIIGASAIGAGRFVGPRSFPVIDCTTVAGLGCWKTFAPRVGFAYDIFGDGKTALKGSFGRYNTPQVTGYLANFNPMVLASETRTWKDLNGDGIPQDNEIGPSGNPNFGKQTATPQLDPKFKREYNLQYAIGVQRQIRTGLSASFNYFRRTVYDSSVLINRAVDPSADWTPISVINPLDGSSFTAYNLNKTAFGRAPDYYQTNANQDLRNNTYQGYEFGVQSRLKGAYIAFGYTLDKAVNVACDASALTSYDINTTSNSLNDPNLRRFCDESGSQFQAQGASSGVPFRSEFKLTGFVPLPFKFKASFAWQDDPEGLKNVGWSITPTTRYPVDCASCPNDATNPALKALVVPGMNNSSLFIPLTSPGSRYLDRLRQVDLGLHRDFHFKERFTAEFGADVFNVNNASTVLSETQTLGTSKYTNIAAFNGPGGIPQTILQPRLLRLSMHFKF